MIRRAPGHRPPPVWPPNPPTPPAPPPPAWERRLPPPPPPQLRHQPPPPRSARPPAPARPAVRPPVRPPVPPPVAAARPRRKRHWGRIVMTVLLVAVVVLVGLVVWVDTSLQRIPALTAYPDRPAAGRGTTWLLVGSDSRAGLDADQQARLATGGEVGTGRTDTIMLVHLPGLGSSAPATMVSLPRDSYVPIPGYGEDKINAAYALGGAPLLAQTVEQATGLRLDHYAEVGFDGFASIVDAVGGVTMCPSEPINDPLAGIDLPAGCQELDGRNALGFVRTRATPRADLDRMTNQRVFMSALLHRAASPAVFLNPLRWLPMAHAAGDALTVDTGAHVWDLARLGWALRGDLTTTTVPIGEFTSSGSGAVVVWDSAAASRLFEAMAADTPIPADVLDPGPTG
ncbi:LCP family protein [Mycolicibacterium baixiangningiae]|uniref:LCP family protein n=1 Tax=Mycolicibacterium baixiangningiae TaxID=2761578 RepID=UPI00384F99DB